MAFRQALPQLLERGFPLGKAGLLRFQRDFLRLTAGQLCQRCFGCGQLAVQCGEGFPFCLGPGGLLLGRLLGLAALLGQLLPQRFGLPQPAELLLEGVQRRLRLRPLGSGLGKGVFLPGQQALQQRFHGVRGRLWLLGEGSQRLGLRVVWGAGNAGQDLPQPDALSRALGAESCALGAESVLQLLVALGAEQLAEDAAALLGGGVQQPGELPLRDHGDLGELVVVQADELDDGGGDLLGPGDGGPAVGKGQGGVGFLGGKALAPGLGAGVLRVAADGVPLAPHLKFQFHKGRRGGVGVLAAEHGPLPHAAAGAVVERVGDGVKEGGLACAGVAGDEV